MEARIFSLYSGLDQFSLAFFDLFFRDSSVIAVLMADNIFSLPSLLAHCLEELADFFALVSVESESREDTIPAIFSRYSGERVAACIPLIRLVLIFSTAQLLREALDIFSLTLKSDRAFFVLLEIRRTESLECLPPEKPDPPLVKLVRGCLAFSIRDIHEISLSAHSSWEHSSNIIRSGMRPISRS